MRVLEILDRLTEDFRRHRWRQSGEGIAVVTGCMRPLEHFQPLMNSDFSLNTFP
jgi:hypothetical protein